MGRARLAVVFAGLLFAGCSSGGGGVSLATGSVDGYVFGVADQLVLRAANEPEQGELPVEGAQIIIDGGGFGVTDRNGFYRIDNVLTGQRSLTATFVGALPAETTVTVLAGQLVHAGAGGGPQATRVWTVMVYLAADNAREPAAIADINEMETVGSSDQVTVYCLLDRAAGFDTSNGDWTSAREFLIQRDDDLRKMTSAGLPSEGGTAVDRGEIDTGDTETLREFLLRGVQTFPAQHYLVVLWGEGFGWRDRATAQSRGFALDEGGGTSISTKDLERALDVNRSIDIVAFDAPLMEMLEVAYEIRRRCDIVLGSEETPPGGGYPYDAWLTALTGRPTQSESDLAKALVDTTIEAYTGQFGVVQAAFRTAQIDEVADALDAFAARLREIGAVEHDRIDQARLATQRFGGTDPLYEGYRDLVDFVDQVVAKVNDSTLALLGRQLVAAVDNALVRVSHAGDSVAASNGLAFYLPVRADYLGPGVSGQAATQDAYERLRLSRDTIWDEWLEEYTRRMPRP